jgi:cbb3-type cytochrome oxidase subunit 3
MQAVADALYPVWVIIFTVIFVAIGVWAFWQSQRQKRRMQDHAEIPFREDADEGRTC